MLRILTFSILFLFHPVHVSITSIDYIHDMRAFRVYIRMYYDDFLLDSKASTVQVSNFSGTSSSTKDLVNDYIREKIMIKADENQLIPKLMDIKLKDNEINIYLDYPTGKKPGTVSVKNLIMTSLYGDQSNMVIVKVNEFEEGVKLSSDLTERTFEIN